MASSDKNSNFLELLKNSKRGKLKVYIGSAAGVGKTYKMLSEAHELKKGGIDVVLGFIETHSRKDTEKLLDGLEIIPRFKKDYHGVKVEEMSMNEIIRRNPEVVIIDELAHTNLPICDNDKRYKDVIEILSKGINVICAFNVQHLDSLNEMIYNIADVRVTETIPDKFLDYADQIVNIDISTDDLIKRLKDGKIYPPEKIKSALKNFFKYDTLGQLRELSLREVAERLESEKRQKIEKDKLNEFDWHSSETIMICLMPSASSQQALIRSASRLAGKLNTDWHAVYVETPEDNPDIIDSDVQRHLFKDIELVKKLGSQFHHIKSVKRFDGFITFAKDINVRHIVVQHEKISFLNKIFNNSLLLNFLRSSEFDIHIFSKKNDKEVKYEDKK